MITVQPAPDMGQGEEHAWQYRVLLSIEEDWSGSAPTEAEAFTRAVVLRDSRLMKIATEEK